MLETFSNLETNSFLLFSNCSNLSSTCLALSAKILSLSSKIPSLFARSVSLMEGLGEFPVFIGCGVSCLGPNDFCIFCFGIRELNQLQFTLEEYLNKIHLYSP